MMLKKIIKLFRNVVCLIGLISISPLIIIAGSIEFIIDQIFKYFSRNSESNMFENIKNMVLPRKKERKKGDPFL